MEYIIGKIYMDTRVAYSSSRYMYLGNDLLFRFMNPEEWHGLDAYILYDDRARRPFPLGKG